MNTSLLNDLLSSIANRGLALAGRFDHGWSAKTGDELARACQSLMSIQGEASGIALSREILLSYAKLPQDEKLSFFQLLLDDYGADHDAVELAAKKFLADKSSKNLEALSLTSRPARYELFMRLNQAPEATHALVQMRADLLGFLKANPTLKQVDRDFSDLFTAWFNRGFLELQNIDWETPATILEKLIQYEAVHGISGWDELRERIDPPDRHIYAFFHPRLKNEPLIFVEVALTSEMPNSVDGILSKDREPLDPNQAKVATFYSISNCQVGLRGIPLGNFLIKQVVKDLKIRHPNLKDFVTLSPIPSLNHWFNGARSDSPYQLPSKFEQAWAIINNGDMSAHSSDNKNLSKDILPAIAWYLNDIKRSKNRPNDPVAAFHLGNGARLERINWGADLSEKGRKQSNCMMVNYRYLLDDIEKNHEQFANDGVIAKSPQIRRAVRDFSQKVINLETRAIDDTQDPGTTGTVAIAGPVTQLKTVD